VWGAALAAAVLATAGCGGSNKIEVPKRVLRTTTTETAGDDPCRLLTRVDIATVFEDTFATGAPAPGAATQCNFARTGAAAGTPAPTVSLHVEGETTIAKFETAKLVAPGAQDVDGVGDEAYYVPLFGRLYVREGVFGFDVGATPALVAGADGVQRLGRLARLVIERHP
jgi:hypothetical protein